MVPAFCTGMIVVGFVVAGITASTAPSRSEDVDKRFLDKTFIVTFDVHGPTSFTFYIDSDAVVHFYHNNPEPCADTGGRAKIGQTETGSYSCENIENTLESSAALKGGVLEYSETNEAMNAKYVFRFSSDGKSCKAVSYNVIQGLDDGNHRPLSCRVRAGKG